MTNTDHIHEDDETSVKRVTLTQFAKATGCHFTTASRLRSGTRMPGRELFGKIVEVYSLDHAESMRAFAGTRVDFGAYLRKNVFHITDEELARDQAVAAERALPADANND